MIKHIILLFSILFCISVVAQEQQIEFQLRYFDEPLRLGQSTAFTEEHAITIDTFKLYISDVKLYLDDKKKEKQRKTKE